MGQHLLGLDMAESVLRPVVMRLGGRRVYIRTTMLRNRTEMERAVKRDFTGVQSGRGCAQAGFFGKGGVLDAVWGTICSQ